MADLLTIYRDNASKAQADADAATLDNVRDRNLRAAAAWSQMADRQERTDRARAVPRAAVTAALEAQAAAAASNDSEASDEDEDGDDADAATLDNVRDRNLRAAAAWEQMAERIARTERARAARLPHGDPALAEAAAGTG